MVLVQFVFLNIILVHIHSAKQIKYNDSDNNWHRIGHLTFWFMKYLSYILFGFFIVAFIAECVKIGKDSDTMTTRPKKSLIVVNIIAGLLILAASICYFVGISKSIYKENGNSNQVKQINDRIIKYNNLSNSNSNSLKVSLISYNDTFSNEDKNYRKALNNINNNHDTSNYLKFSLKKMDKSRNSILSNIDLFISKHKQFSLFVQNNLQIIEKEFFNSDSNFFEHLNNTNHEIETYENQIHAIGGFILSACMIIVAIFYSIIVFSMSKCADIFLCIYPIFSVAIVTGGTLVGVYINENKYNDLHASCSKAIYSRILNTYSNNILENFNINDYFEKNEIKNLYDSVVSAKMHENFDEIYKQYSNYEIYHDNLNEMQAIINENENTLMKMKALIKNISILTYLEYSNLTAIRNNLKNDDTYSHGRERITKKNCDSIIKGFNACVYGSIVLFIGLVVMFFTTCGRRDKWNYEGGESFSRAQCSNYDFNAGTKWVYYIINGEDDSFNVTDVIKNGEFGRGFYFYANYSDVKEELKDKRDYVVLSCKVDLGRCYNVFYNYQFHFPDTLIENNCVSVFAKVDYKEKYIFYDSDRIKKIEIGKASI